jgi:hypothetical protein
MRTGLGNRFIGFVLLDFKLDVPVSSQGSTFARVPRRRNLHQLRFRRERLRHVRVDLRPETLRADALCGIKGA